MTSPIRIERHGDVLAIVCHASGALDAAMREGLDAAIRQGVADASIAAMVIRREGEGDDRFFADEDAGSGAQPMGPLLPVVAATIEAASKPVVAAIGGEAMGGGLELALACHYRVATPDAMLGLPAVRAGLVPGAGGTQRLTRIAGVPMALAMIALGDPVGARQALDAGLVDRIASADGLAADAVAFARDIAHRRPTPRAAEREARADPAAVAAFRAAHPAHPAAEAAVACVEKATDGSSFADGLAFEHRQLLALKAGRPPAA